MVITWHGQNCFKVAASRGKEGSLALIIDLFSKETGLKPPKSDADVLIFSSIKEPQAEAGSFVITGPGEYDVKGAYIQGMAAPGKKEGGDTIYVIDAEDMRLCHLGGIKQPELTSEQLEEIGEVDILFLPVGGGDGLDAKGAIKIMSQIEPKITIPMNYKVPGLKEKADDLGEFLKALGIKSIPPQDKLSMKKRDLPADEAKIIVLNP